MECLHIHSEISSKWDPSLKTVDLYVPYTHGLMAVSYIIFNVLAFRVTQHVRLDREFSTLGYHTGPQNVTDFRFTIFALELFNFIVL